MSIVPALIAVQLSTTTANGGYSGLSNTRINREWRQLSGWRSTLFGFGFAILVLIVVLVNCAAIALGIAGAGWLGNFAPAWVPVWAKIIGGVLSVGAGVGVNFLTLRALYS
jgi:hypothetical protein